VLTQSDGELVCCVDFAGTIAGVLAFDLIFKLDGDWALSKVWLTASLANAATATNTNIGGRCFFSRMKQPGGQIQFANVVGGSVLSVPHRIGFQLGQFYEFSSDNYRVPTDVNGLGVAIALGDNVADPTSSYSGSLMIELRRVR